MKQNSGFTLLEIIIALAILSFSLVALSTLMGSGHRAVSRAQRLNRETLLARQEMMEVKLMLEEKIQRGVLLDPEEKDGVFDKPFEDYHWSYSLSKVQLPKLNLSNMLEGVSLGNQSDTDAATAAQKNAQIAQGIESLTQMVTDKISEATRELKVSVYKLRPGEDEKNAEKVTLTTHLTQLR